MRIRSVLTFWVVSWIVLTKTVVPMVAAICAVFADRVLCVELVGSAILVGWWVVTVVTLILLVCATATCSSTVL